MLSNFFCHSGNDRRKASRIRFWTSQNDVIVLCQTLSLSQKIMLACARDPPACNAGRSPALQNQYDTPSMLISKARDP